MNIIIPIAGKDERFEQTFHTTKPLVPVQGRPLIQWCVELLPFAQSSITFIVLAEEDKKYQIRKHLQEIFPEARVALIPRLTAGAACTVLSQKERINSDEELFIFLADIYFQTDFSRLEAKYSSDIKGIIPTFFSNQQKYSYALLGDDGKTVAKVAEKEVISSNASAGCYYFRQGRDFVWAAESMIKKNLRVNNLFYICPVYNQLIERGDTIGILPVEFLAGLGSPKEVKLFQQKMPHEKPMVR